MAGRTSNYSLGGNQLPINPTVGGGAQQEEPRMSSREISDVVDSRHDKVKQSIERLVQRGVIVQPPMGNEQDTDAMGRPRTTSVYLVSKRDSYVVVAQLSPEFTARLVDRWQELEQQASQPALPDFSDPVAAARAWADALEHKQAAEGRMIAAERRVTDLTPKAEAFDILDSAEGSVNVRIAAKILEVPERKFTKWLEVNGWVFRQNGVGTMQAYIEKRNRGYLEHKALTYKGRDGEDRIGAQVMITAKGMARLAQIFTKNPIN